MQVLTINKPDVHVNKFDHTRVTMESMLKNPDISACEFLRLCYNGAMVLEYVPLRYK